MIDVESRHHLLVGQFDGTDHMDDEVLKSIAYEIQEVLRSNLCLGVDLTILSIFSQFIPEPGYSRWSI